MLIILHPSDSKRLYLKINGLFGSWMKINIVARKRLEINILTRHSFAWRTGWICRPLIEQTDALTMYNVFCLRLGSMSIGHVRHVKHGTIMVSGFGCFHKNCCFLWEKNVSKTNLGSTIHYTYTSYNKYFRLCIVSEESMKSVSSFSRIDIYYTYRVSFVLKHGRKKF